MGEKARVTKRSCAFCQFDDRDDLEKALVEGDLTPKQLDLEMGWRENTSDRHFRNHMGEYHLAANTQCKVCMHDQRAELEMKYFERAITSEDISALIECPEESVYRHMKYHFQPLVKRDASYAVSIKVGEEVNVLRGNVEKLNDKLQGLFDSGSVHQEDFVNDAVKLHKEVRESIKDLMKYQDMWMAEPETKMVADTINILKVELGKESPETWKRLKKKLQSTESME